ncbi:MAG: HD domain-containing protein, partial [Deltaproteobacteria bacterium]|nr:HD domain-containing protein [Deltaproteobacteria bacterium]
MSEHVHADDGLALDELLRRAGTYLSEKDIRELRHHVLGQLFVLFKSARIRELDNDVFVAPVRRFCEVIRAYLRVTGQPVVVRLIHEEFYVNNGLVTATERHHWEQTVFLKQALKRMGVGEMNIMRETDERQLRAFLLMLMPHIRGLAPPISGVIRQPPFVVHSTDAVTETEAEFQLRASERMGQSFPVLLLQAEQLQRHLADGRGLAMREARRTLQDLVTDSERAEWLLLGIAELMAHKPTLTGHMCRTAVYAMVIAKALGLNRLDVMQTSLAAFVHDLGREGAMDEILEWHQDPAAPLDTVRALLLSQAMDHSAALRTVTAFEYQAPLDGKPRSPAAGWGLLGTYTGPREPTLAARIVAVADAYDTMRYPARGRPGLLPDARMRVLLAGRGERFDRLLVNVLFEIMGPHPPGSLVRLSDGRQAVVTRPARRPAPPDRPTVAVLTDAEGNPAARRESIDLAREGSDLLLLGQRDAAGLG